MNANPIPEQIGTDRKRKRVDIDDRRNQSE